MQKVYKMPILYGFYNHGNIRLEVTGAIALRDELRDCIGNEAMRSHMKDILAYRTMEYYRRRYETNLKGMQ